MLPSFGESPLAEGEVEVAPKQWPIALISWDQGSMAKAEDQATAEGFAGTIWASHPLVTWSTLLWSWAQLCHWPGGGLADLVAAMGLRLQWDGNSRVARLKTIRVAQIYTFVPSLGCSFGQTSPYVVPLTGQGW